MTLTTLVLWGMIAVGADAEGVRMVSLQGAVSRYAPGVTEAQAIDRPGVFRVGERVILVDDARLRLDGPGRIDLTGAGEIAFVKPGRYRWNGRSAYIEAGDQTLFFDVGRSSVHVRDGKVRLRRVGDGVFVEVIGGRRAAVFTAGGNVLTVSEGKGVRLDAAGRADKPVTLISGPSVIAPEDDRPLRSFRFAWRPVEGAGRYRFELARDESFREVLYAEDVSATTYRDENRTLPLGRLFWRVTAVGEDGFMGLPSPPRAVRILP